MNEGKRKLRQRQEIIKIIIKDLKMDIFYFFADLSVDNVEFFGFSLIIPSFFVSLPFDN